MSGGEVVDQGGLEPLIGRMRSGRWLVTMLAAVSACVDAPGSDARAAVIPWLEFSDTVELGGAGAEGPQAFGTIRAATLLADDARLVVADGQTQELHLFSLTGQHLRRLAGRGGGPGEHRAIREVWGTRDGGFCTWDIQTIRVSRFDSEGHLVSTGTADLNGMESIRPSFQGFAGECGFVLRDQRSEMGMRDVPEGMRRDTVTFVLFGADGAELRRLVRRSGSEQWFRNSNRSWGHVALVFGDELFGFTHGDEFWVGSSDKLVWTRLSLEGDTVGIVAIEQDTRTATDADVEAERERRIAEIKARVVNLPIGPPDLLERMAESKREGVRAVPARGTIPAYDVVVPTQHGGLWFRRYPKPSEAEATWVLMDSLARPVGQLTLPRNDSILAASESAVLVATRDELEAPILRILRR